MAERRGFLPRRGGAAPEESPASVVATGHAPIAPISRAPPKPHHWLSVLVARPGPHEPVPAPGARIVVRPFPRGSAQPGEVCARGTTAADGTVSLLLPAGRYAVAATHENDGRCVTISLEHPGRAVLLLESLGRRAQLTIEVARPDGGALAEALVDVRTVPSGTLAARAATDERGVVQLNIPPGAYEVRVGQTSAKTYVEADTLLRLTAVPGASPVESAPVTKYAHRVRVATNYVAPYDIGSVREDVFN